jgi:hypothetical protein
MTAAYDYESQQWLEGTLAVKVRLEQIHNEIKLLTGDSGASYARFIGVRDIPEAVLKLRAEAFELWNN